MVRKLVEDDKVFAIFQLLGTPTNTVVHKYLNQKKVPQLFVATGASKWGDPKNFRGRWAGSPTTTPRRDLCQARAGQAQGQSQGPAHRHDLPERRFGKDYVGGFLAGPRQGEREVRHRQGELRSHRSDRRQPDHPDQEFRRQRSSSTTARRKRRHRPSARSPTSAGSPTTISPTSPPRWRPC